MPDNPFRRTKPEPVPPVAASAREKTLPLRVNGKDFFHNGDPDMPLLWYLRDVLRLTGTKFGCGIGMWSAQLETGNVSAPFSPFSLSRLKSE